MASGFRASGFGLVQDLFSLTPVVVVQASRWLGWVRRGSDPSASLRASRVRPYSGLLCSGGKVLADALDGIALVVVQSQELEAVAEALAVTDDGADFNWVRRKG